MDTSKAALSMGYDGDLRRPSASRRLPPVRCEVQREVDPLAIVTGDGERRYRDADHAPVPKRDRTAEMKPPETETDALNPD